ncbi:hypothetical protein MPSEU_000358400 [Mayamaea pseudoterrestris]|nr:hypothetical protein MPSEU_000358400 [Mayamaea pseudoterrestris]
MPCYSLRRCSRVQSVPTTDTVMRKTTNKSLLQRLLRLRGNEHKQLRQSQRTMETTSMQFAAPATTDCHAAAAVRPMPSMMGNDDYANYQYHASSPCRFAATTITRSSSSPAIPYEISIPSDFSHDSDEDYWEQLALIDNCQQSPAEAAYGSALDCFDAQEYHQALEQVQIGVTALHDTDDLRCKLLLVQAEALVKLERYAPGLECYQQVLDHVKKNNKKSTFESPISLDCANLYCTCGRVAARAKDYEKSIYYFEQGLAVVAASNGSSNAAMAALLYHELALVYRNGLHNATLAVQMLLKALACESTLYQQALDQVHRCCNCSSNARCQRHATLLQGIGEQVRTTRTTIGRIHYEQSGDLETAMRFTSMKMSLTSVV